MTVHPGSQMSPGAWGGLLTLMPGHGCQRAAGAVVPRDWLQRDKGSPSALPNGHALNPSGDREEHCLNPQLPVNYLVGSHQNDAFVTARALMAAVAGIVGLSSHGDLLLSIPSCRSAQPKGASGSGPKPS